MLSYIIPIDKTCEFITEYQNIKNQVFLIRTKNAYHKVLTPELCSNIYQSSLKAVAQCSVTL